MIRPMTQGLVEAFAMDLWPSIATIVDFGLKSQKHYEALCYPVRAGEIKPEQLDEALGDGKKLTALVRSARSNPHKEIVFSTPYDNLVEESEDEAV